MPREKAVVFFIEWFCVLFYTGKPVATTCLEDATVRPLLPGSHLSVVSLLTQQINHPVEHIPITSFDC